MADIAWLTIDGLFSRGFLEESLSTATAMEDPIMPVQELSVWEAIRDSTKWPLVVGLCLAFASLAVLFHFEPHSTWQKAGLAGLSEIGFAFIIAWIVSVTIEVKSRKEYLRQVEERERKFQDEITLREHKLSKSIFDYLYSIRLPKDIFALVEKNVFQSHFIKEYQRVEYEMVEENGEWLLWRVQFEHMIRNISGSTTSHDVRFFIDNLIASDVPSFTKVGLYKVFVGEDIPSGEFDGLRDREGSTAEYDRYSRTITLDPDDTRVVRIGFYYPKRKSDSELWRTMDLCKKLDVIVRFDPDKYNIHLVPVHSHDAFDRCDRMPYGISAEINSPLLSHNGFYMWWSRKEGGAAGLTPTPPTAQKS